jgi:hypothetical protein
MDPGQALLEQALAEEQERAGRRGGGKVGDVGSLYGWLLALLGS